MPRVRAGHTPLTSFAPLSSGTKGAEAAGVDGLCLRGGTEGGGAPRPPRASPLVSLRCTRAPLRWSEGGVRVWRWWVAAAWGEVGACGRRPSAPGIPRSFRCAALAPPYAGAKGAYASGVVPFWIPAYAGMTGWGQE